MMSIVRVILLVVIFSVFAVGCSPKETLETVRKEVEIIRISGTLPAILSSTGALFGNDSVKIGEQTLVFTIKEQSGHVRTLEVLDGRSISKVALLSRVCVGSKMSMIFTIVGSEEVEKLENDPKYYLGRVSADEILVKEDCSAKN